MHKKMPIMEIFGPTIQGEGIAIGQKTMFVRTGGCDYSCSWCDSAFTWNGEEKARMMTAPDVWEGLKELAGGNFQHVTISGGNPALIGAPMYELVYLLKRNGMTVALETQGSRWQNWFEMIDQLTISPKPPSSGMKTNYKTLDDIIERLELAKNVTLKVVIFDDADYAYAKNLHKNYPLIPMFLSVGNPDVKGDVSEFKLLRLYGELVDRIMWDPEMRNVRVLPQLHVLLWGNKRGV